MLRFYEVLPVHLENFLSETKIITINKTTTKPKLLGKQENVTENLGP